MTITSNLPYKCKISAIFSFIAEILRTFAPERTVDDMKNYSQSIMDYAALHPNFGLQDLCAYLDGEANISRQTVSWYLTKLTESRQLRRIGHGLYAKPTKQEFVIIPTDEDRTLHDELKRLWPFANFCIYNGSVISPLQHHLAANNITYIETEREATSAVFNHLRDDGRTAYLRPTRDLIYNYIDLSQPAIFVKPLITESPTLLNEGVMVPTLEKLLVDLQKDQDFFYLQEAEGLNIFSNALSLYTINESRLLRYASRRGIRKEIETIIQSINSND